MRSLECEMYFEVDGISLENETLGSELAIRTEGALVRVALPTRPDEFKFGRVQLKGDDDDPRNYPPSTAMVSTPGNSFSEVRLLRVTVELEAEPEEPSLNRTRLTQAVELGRRTVCDLVDWVWVEGQAWRAPRDEYPKLVSAVQLVDADSGEVDPLMISNPIPIRVIPPDGVFEKARFEALAPSIGAGPPPLADLLLTEARHFLWSGQPFAPDRLVLLAAMACEVRVKEVLRRVAPPEAHALVGLILDNPRDVSLAAANLFDKALEAAAGRSLRIEDKQTYNKLSELFTARNRVVHRGISPAKDEATAGVHAAVRAFSWLDDVVESVGAPSQAAEPPASD